jgi:hypothetical protein
MVSSIIEPVERNEVISIEIRKSPYVRHANRC